MTSPAHDGSICFSIFWQCFLDRGRSRKLFDSTRTSFSSPSRDAAGMIGLEEVRSPRHTDCSHSRIVLKTFFLRGKLLQLHQSDVVLIAAGIVPAGHPKSEFNIFPILLPFSQKDHHVMIEVRWMDGWMDGWMDEWVGGWVDEWVGWVMDGWMDG